ncbi:MAG TPA: C1 family peptidase [Calditrichia bacterium]|nr:aminopeptidase [Calditrichota bacterium]HQU72855.1 C1 family peptidase [Calditrichia bacterium]HQV32101.1 C1 family peptidase [Calditrichia bacterium]
MCLARNFIIVSLFVAAAIFAQTEKGDPEGFIFTEKINLSSTPVKNQWRTGTCWSFATSSFIEAEVLRKNGKAIDLSEMFNVRNTYPMKAKLFVRYHGKRTFDSGSLSGDMMRIFRVYGAVPESAYPGFLPEFERHNHKELDAVLKAMMDVFVENPAGALSDRWLPAVEGVLDAYLGEMPENFTYNGKSYTPKSFAASLGINPDDYVELTSFTHHPFDEKIVLELPDNWADNRYFNIPLDELMKVLNRSLEMGYTVGWDGDVSEKTFNSRKGLATLPLRPWDLLSSGERNRLQEKPEAEIEVTQAVRQVMFDNYTTTDDHLMHITGIASDQNGDTYYITKNSYGEERGPYQGFVYMSESYTRAKTVSILVHKDVLPKDLAKRMGL